MNNIFGNIENMLTGFQTKITEIHVLVTGFQDKINEIEILVNRSIKIAITVIVAWFIFCLIREYLNWRIQVKVQKQNEELLKKMTRIITLLEENLKNK